MNRPPLLMLLLLLTAQTYCGGSPDETADDAGALHRDRTAPKVSLSRPAAGEVVSGVIKLDAVASDDTGVKRVRYEVDGIEVAQDSTCCTWDEPWDTRLVADGEHTLIVRAWDRSGNEGRSAPVTVTVQNTTAQPGAPVVSLVSPVSGAIVSGTILLDAHVRSDTSVALVRYFVDGLAVAEDDTCCAWDEAWDTTSVADGPHTVVATAYAADGQQGSSQIITVNVANNGASVPNPGEPVWGMFSGPDNPVPTELCGSGSKVKVMVIEFRWRSIEPSDDAWNNAFFQSLRDRIARMKAAGCQVILNYGLHHAPDFILNSPNGRFVNQYGTTYTASDEPNLIFTTALRAEAQEYTNRVFAELGTDFHSVRVGGGHWGELTYPQIFNNSSGTGCTDTPISEPAGKLCNYYWAFDANAKASKQAHGVSTTWIPGQPSPNGEARAFLSWYLDRLVEFQNWQIASLRTAGFKGLAAVLYPSWGMREGHFDDAVRTHLNGSSSPEVNGEVQRGFDHRRQIEALTDANTAKWGTWAQKAGTMSWLANLNPAGRSLPLMGENSGPGTADKAQPFEDACRLNEAAMCAWIRWGEAHDAFLNAISTAP